MRWTRRNGSWFAREAAPRWAACALFVWAACSAFVFTPLPALAQTADELFAYRVEPRDTLIGLHARLMRPEADWRVVQKLNRVADPRRLQPGALLRIPISMLREEGVPAEVLQLHGEVWVERAGAARQALATSTALMAGDTVVTGAQSSLALRFADGARTLLGPESRLLIERHVRLGASGAVDTRLRLLGGGAEAEVPPATAPKPAPRFELRTPVVNLGVRGTEFRGRVDGPRTLAEVLQGRVAVGARAVEAGSGTVASEGSVAPPRPLLPAPEVSAVPLRIERMPLQLPLGRAEGATRYRAQVYDMGETPKLMLEGLFEQSFAAWSDDIADGRYELRVRASDADGIEGQTARQTFTLKARPEPPFLLRPRAGEKVVEPEFTLAWARNPQAARYKLQVAPRADFATPQVDRADLETNELRITLPPGTYHWRVASVRPDGDAGPWGDAQTLERVEQPAPPPPPPPPGAPTSQAPHGASEGMMLSWSAAPLPGATHQVQVARDPAFTQLVLDERTPRTELLWAHPEPGVYHVRVRTVGVDGRAGAFGSPQVVEVPRSMWWLWLLPLLLLLF